MAPVCGLRIEADATERMRQRHRADPRRGGGAVGADPRGLAT